MVNNEKRTHSEDDMHTENTDTVVHHLFFSHLMFCVHVTSRYDFFFEGSDEEDDSDDEDDQDDDDNQAVCCLSSLLLDV